MNKRIACLAATGLALLGGLGCFYPPDTQPVPTASNEPEELPLTPAETNQLRGLHKIALQKFLESPEFGFSRMGPPPKYIVPTDVLDRIVVEHQGQNPVSPTTLRSSMLHNGNNLNKVNLTKALRVNADVAQLKLEDLGVRFEQVQLMGLAKQPEPTVFDIKDDTPAGGKPTRPLDPFEQRGLAKLQANSPMHVESVQGNMRVLAPIYAGATCVSCHTKHGELLGAFSYTLASTGSKVLAK
jgi:hypothetical protein